ncbi:dihydroxy-acid dehydratase, chloroplastic-like protein isoform X1, partial [Tanacetum coccineum]
PALVFEGEESMIAAISEDPTSFKGKVVVIRGEGPKGGPRMPEMLTPTSAIMGAGLGKIMLANEACLADMISHGNWNWPTEWMRDFPELSHIIVPTLNQRNDVAKWVDNNNERGRYNTKNVWQRLVGICPYHK